MLRNAFIKNICLELLLDGVLHDFVEAGDVGFIDQFVFVDATRFMHPQSNHLDGSLHTFRTAEQHSLK